MLRRLDLPRAHRHALLEEAAPLALAAGVGDAFALAPAKIGPQSALCSAAKARLLSWVAFGSWAPLNNQVINCSSETFHRTFAGDPHLGCMKHLMLTERLS